MPLILSLQGTIVVASNATLDRERIEGGVVSLLVKATDTPRGRTSDQRQTDVPVSSANPKLYL